MTYLLSIKTEVQAISKKKEIIIIITTKQKNTYQKSDLPKLYLSLHSSSLDLHNYLRKVRHLSIQSRTQFIIATSVTKTLPTKWIEMKPHLPQTHLACAEGEITMLLDVYFTGKVTGSKLAGNPKTSKAEFTPREQLQHVCLPLLAVNAGQKQRKESRCIAGT